MFGKKNNEEWEIIILLHVCLTGLRRKARIYQNNSQDDNFKIFIF